MERKLTVILAADVAGYSRLAAADEEGTLATLAIYRAAIADLIAEHGGRIFGTAGDSIIAEFASAVRAVRAAVAIQRALHRRNADLAPDRRMEFRIGLNLGDVVTEGADLLGDGVNVAARLEGLADPGGICISRSVRDQVRDRLEIRLEDQGEVTVKNIARPVRVFRVPLNDLVPITASSGAEKFVLSAVVRSFALLMGNDNEQARADLAHNRGLFEQAIDKHGGQTLESAGDGVVAAFSHPADAVHCSIEAQASVTAWNDSVPAERRVRFRVGIGLSNEAMILHPESSGPVKVEALAAPGETCVGQEVYDRLLGDEAFQFEQLSNPARNLAAFKLVLPSKPDSAIVGHPAPQCQGLDLPLPARPSIIVLPFKNLTKDPEQDHFAEGIRIDIQTALVKISGLFAIAAGPANSYRGRDIPPTQVGKEMGVQFVLEGVVQRSGDRVRITTQLTDTGKGQTVWAERYDRKLGDTFAVQDEITEKVVTALDVKLVAGEQARVWRKTLRDPKALDLYYRGIALFMRFDKESLAAARQFFEAVSRIAPGVALGPTNVAFTHWWDAMMGWSDSSADSLAQAGAWAERAAAMEDADGQGHIVLAYVHLINGRHDDALRIGEEAVRIRPQCANTNALFGNILVYCGKPETAIHRLKNAIRYSPVYSTWWIKILATAYRDNGQYGQAISTAKEAIRLNPGDADACAILASAYVAGGWPEIAREVARNVLEIDPHFSLSSHIRKQPYKDQAKQEDVLADLREAGLPE